MKKKAFKIALYIIVLIISCILFLAFLVSEGEKPGKTKNAVIEINQSQKFSEDEIQAAVDCVFLFFTGYKGCVLKKIWYNEERSNKEIGIDNTNQIVLWSNFYVKKFSDSGGWFSTGSYYNDWSWRLTRESETDEWRVTDFGYG